MALPWAGFLPHLWCSIAARSSRAIAEGLAAQECRLPDGEQARHAGSVADDDHCGSMPATVRRVDVVLPPDLTERGGVVGPSLAADGGGDADAFEDGHEGIVPRFARALPREALDGVVGDAVHHGAHELRDSGEVGGVRGLV